MAESSHPQVKLEQQNIKERLNLHVKRRLQQDAEVPIESPELLPGDPSAATNMKRSKGKEVPKQRKPYQKRTEKAKTETAKFKKGKKLFDYDRNSLTSVNFSWTTWQPSGGGGALGRPGAGGLFSGRAGCEILKQGSLQKRRYT